MKNSRVSPQKVRRKFASGADNGIESVRTGSDGSPIDAAALSNHDRRAFHKQHTTLIRRRNRPFRRGGAARAGVPLLSKRSEWTHQARLVTIHALVAIAASLLDPAS